MKALHKHHQQAKDLIGLWPTRGNGPGEPLYTLPEIAQRMGVKFELLRRRATMNGGLHPWKETSRGRNTYRLSDARRWWATFTEGQ